MSQLLTEHSHTRQDVLTGDVVLFSGRSPLHNWVQRLTRSRWSQVGLVLRLPIYSELMLLEATSIPICPDIETGRHSAGVRTVILDAKLAVFDGSVIYRRLQPSLTPAFIDKLIEFRKSVVGRPFDFSLLAARKSIRRCHTIWEGKAFTCSSLVAYAYQSIGILAQPPNGPLPSNVLPGDFSNDTLPLIKGFSFDQLLSSIHCDQ
jgi:hypothetical protein